MSEFSLDTTEKVLSAIAALIAIGGALVWFFQRKPPESTPTSSSPTTTNAVNQAVTVNVGTSTTPESTAQRPTSPRQPDVAELKRSVQILFIDDDREFKIVGVLKKMGWENTRLVTDLPSLENKALIAADVVFVDIQGVGRAMQYSDEGLGLALAIKRRHPQKKVIIYSAEEKGARFHEAFPETDYNLPKTADPIRFEDTIVKVLNK